MTEQGNSKELDPWGSTRRIISTVPQPDKATEPDPWVAPTTMCVGHIPTPNTKNATEPDPWGSTTLDTGNIAIRNTQPDNSTEPSTRIPAQSPKGDNLADPDPWGPSNLYTGHIAALNPQPDNSTDTDIRIPVQSPKGDNPVDTDPWGSPRAMYTGHMNSSSPQPENMTNSDTWGPPASNSQPGSHTDLNRPTTTPSSKGDNPADLDPWGSPNAMYTGHIPSSAPCNADNPLIQVSTPPPTGVTAPLPPRNKTRHPNYLLPRYVDEEEELREGDVGESSEVSKVPMTTGCPVGSSDLPVAPGRRAGLSEIPLEVGSPVGSVRRTLLLVPNT